jgi:hypothetical protein
MSADKNTSKPIDSVIELHTKCLLDSYFNCTGNQLIERVSMQVDAEQLFTTDFVVVSHDTSKDPILNYGNATALDLWEMTWAEFTQTPSRYTAEENLRTLREKMLQSVHDKGYFDRYEGVRVSKSGKRFKIKNVLIWNLSDEEGRPYGQAATFNEWEWI